MAGEEWLEGEGGDPKEAKQTKETTQKKEEEEEERKKKPQSECSGAYIKLLRRHFHKTGYCSFMYFLFDCLSRSLSLSVLF